MGYRGRYPAKTQNRGFSNLRFRIRTLLIIVAVAAVAAFMISSVLQVKNVIRNGYSQWWVADMVVLHLDANNNEWPKNWDDLRDDFQTCVTNARGQPWEFQELRSRVEIDWDANPNDLIGQQTGGAPTFRAIWLTDGTRSSWGGREPNQIVLDYLNSKQ